MSSSSYDVKPVEQNVAGDAQETSFYNATDTDSFLPAKAAKENGGDLEASSAAASQKFSEASPKKNKPSEFCGLTREELERYSNDPKWVRIRWVLFIILLIGWASVLIVAIVLVVVATKCPPQPNLEWHQEGIAYRVDVEKFLDTDGNGIGDLAGVEKKLDHFKDLSVKSVWIGDIIDGNAKDRPKMSVGTLDEFKQLAKTFKKKGIRVVMDMDLAGNEEELEDLVRKWADAGAEGFVLSPAGATDEVFNKSVSSLQALLDEEFNKKDDRARIIIGAEDVKANSSDALTVLVHQPDVSCADRKSTECAKKTVEALGKANLEATRFKLGTSETPAPWRVLQAMAGMIVDDAAGNVALKLTLPGTPNIIYGDEIGLSGSPQGYMVWDDSANGGFTSNQSWTNPSPANVNSVLAQKSAGFDGVSIYNMVKDLAAVRAKEPSLRWGEFQPVDFGEGVIAFVRNATLESPIVVAVNPMDDKAGSLVFEEYSMGEVLVSSGLDVKVDESIDLSAVYLPKGSVFVAKMSVPVEE